MSSFIHRQFIPNLYEFVSSAEQEYVGNQTVVGPHWLLLYFFHIWVNGVQQMFGYQHTLPVQQKKYRFGGNWGWVN